MCGIVGVLGDIGLNEEKLFSNLLIIDTIRGVDSTGVIRVSDKNKVSYYKDAITGGEMVKTTQYHNLLSSHNKVLIGHNRAATIGKVTATNAHPFHYGNIIGVHNGTIRSTAGLEDHTMFEVDSENLIYDISLRGIETTYKHLRGGAAALVFYDKSKHEVNFIRNTQRPLCFGTLKGSNCVVWASTPEILKCAVATTKGVSLVDDEITILPTDTLVKFNTKAKKSKVLIKPSTKEVKSYSYTPSNNTYRQSHTSIPARQRALPPHTGISREAMSKLPLDSATIHFKVVAYDNYKLLCSHKDEKDFDIAVPCYNGQFAHIVERVKAGETFEASGKSNYVSSYNPKLPCIMIKSDSFQVKETKTLSLVKPEEKKEKKPSASQPTDGVDEAIFATMTSNGCINCNHVPDYEDSGDIIWIDERSYICSDECDIYSFRQLPPHNYGELH